MHQQPSSQRRLSMRRTPVAQTCLWCRATVGALPAWPLDSSHPLPWLRGLKIRAACRFVSSASQRAPIIRQPFRSFAASGGAFAPTVMPCTALDCVRALFGMHLNKAERRSSKLESPRPAMTWRIAAPTAALARCMRPEQSACVLEGQTVVLLGRAVSVDVHMQRASP